MIKCSKYCTRKIDIDKSRKPTDSQSDSRRQEQFVVLLQTCLSARVSRRKSYISFPVFGSGSASERITRQAPAA